jgi:peptide/nickel transport system substrate-binding protein
MDGTTATLTLNSEMSWASGDPVTAEDVVTQLRLEAVIGEQIGNFLESVEAVDDTTVELQLNEEFNPNVFIDILNPTGGVLAKSDGEFADWLQRFQEEDKEAVMEEWSGFQYATDHSPAANGPFQIETTEANRWVLSGNENYPVETNIDQREALVVDGDQEIWQLMASERLDGRVLQAVEESVAQTFPDWLHKVDIPIAGGLAPMWNMHQDVFAKREFRQAMAYLISRSEVEKNVNPRHTAVEQVTGLTIGETDIWLGDDFLSSLNQYGMESKPDMAEQKMQEAGFTTENGSWLDGNGEPISVEWSSPPWPGGIGVGETLRATLPAFGIEFSSTTLEPPQFFSGRAELDYDFAFNALLGGPHPYFFAENVLQAPTTEQTGFATDTVMLPPKGDADGEPQEFDLQEMITTLAVETDEAALTETVEEYSWYFNQELPYFQLTSAFAPSFIASHEWEIPDPDDDVMGLLGPANELFRESEEGSNQARIQAK